MTPTIRIAAALPLLGALVLSTDAAAQGARFDGWEAMRDPSFVFDPDHRTIRGFSVRTSATARAAFDDVEAALDARQPALAAERLLDIASGDPASVLQVAGCADCDDERSRWVGAAEWALYQLATRIPASVLASVAAPEERAAVESATRWRDVDALRLLALRLEGLPEGRRAADALARLSAERGEAGTALGAAARALDQGADGSLAELRARVEPPAQEPPPALDLPVGLDVTWHHTTTMAQLSSAPSVRFNPFTALRTAYDAPTAPIEPVIADGVVYLADSISVSALVLFSGRELWHHVGPMERREREFDDDSFALSKYASPQRPRAISPYQLCRPTLTDDLVLATEQSLERAYPLDTFEGYPINNPLPHRRLVALDRGTGEVVWTQARGSLDPAAFENRFDVAGPVVVGDGMVYAAGSITEGAISAYLAAFDLATGELRWRSMLCSGQQELTMFNRPFQEHVVSPPALIDGALYVCTNLGVIGSVDAWSGRVRWLAAYDPIPRETSRGVRPNNPRTVPWTNHPPFVEGGTLFVSPLDSYVAYGLDPATGRRVLDPISSRPLTERQIRQQLVPTGRGHALLVTQEGAAVLDPASRRPAGVHRPFAGARVDGVASSAGDVLLVPIERGTERGLALVDLDDGLVVGDREWPSSNSPRFVQRVVSAGAALLLSDGYEVAAALNVPGLEASIASSGEASPSSTLALAELALVGGRDDEARTLFQRVLDGGPGPLAARAASGRLEATLRRARSTRGVDAWDAVLSACVTEDQLFDQAPEAFSAFSARGAWDSIGTWLARMAARAPDRPLTLGPEGPRPVAFLAAVQSLSDASPAAQVDLLVRISQEFPDESWNGEPARDVARRRIDALLAEHGRALYARHEAAAERELAAGRPLDEVEARYPNAAVVSVARVDEMQRLLADGDARAVLDLSAGRTGAAVLAPREQAARALGETAYADLVGGAVPAPRGALTRLPSDLSGARTFVLSDRFRVVFPDVTGRPDVASAHLALGCIDGAGEMFVVDTERGELAWSGRALPGGLTQASSSVASFHVEGDLLVAQGRGTFVALRLSDGIPVWTHTIPGRTLEVVPVGGLLVALSRGADQAFVLTALGVHGGETMFSFALPDCSDARLARAGGGCVVLTRTSSQGDRGAREKRLLAIDLARGAPAVAIDVDDGCSLVASHDDPPLALLARRLDDRDGRRSVGPLYELSAFDGRDVTLRWREELDVELLSSERILDLGDGHLALRASARRPESTRRVDRLLPLDARVGLVRPASDPPLLELVQGQTHGVAPRLVLRDPVDPDRLVMLDGATLAQTGTLHLPPGGSGHLQVFHGSDGFLLVSEPLEGPSSVWLVRDDPARQPVRAVLADLPQDGTEVRLVDDAVLVASRGTVCLLRSAQR